MHLKNRSCYLAGPVDHDPNAGDWRDKVTEELLKPLSIKALNPLDKNDSMHPACFIDPKEYFKALNDKPSLVTVQEVFEAMNSIIDNCLDMVEESDFIICHMPKNIFTFGTIDEILQDYRKPVVFHCPDLIPSTWALGRFSTPENWRSVFFDNWDSIYEFLREIDRNGSDQLKWERLFR